MQQIVLYFVFGLVIGASAHWLGQKVYWRLKWSTNRRYLRYRTRRFVAYRFRRFRVLRALVRDRRADYVSDYRLNSLFEKIARRHDD
jgi:hypothetical protein